LSHSGGLSCHRSRQDAAPRRAVARQSGLKREIMQTNSHTHSADSSAQPDVLKDDQFRGDAVQPGSVLLIGDTAVFVVAGHFCAT